MKWKSPTQMQTVTKNTIPMAIGRAGGNVHSSTVAVTIHSQIGAFLRWTNLCFTKIPLTSNQNVVLYSKNIKHLKNMLMSEAMTVCFIQLFILKVPVHYKNRKGMASEIRRFVHLSKGL